MSNAVALISGDIYGTRDTFASVQSDRSINFESEAGFAIQAITGNDYAMGIAMKNRQSVVNAVTNIAAIGISLNPAKKQAYLVPRDGKICLDISYMGLMDLAMATGSILWAQAELVYTSDAFALSGFDKPPTHTYNPFATDRGEIIGCYAVVKTHTGDYLTTCMSRDEIDGIMNRSQSVKSGRSSPWKTDYGEMAKKTVVKRAYKYWPKTERLEQAIHHLNTDGGEGLANIAQPAQTEQQIDVAPIIAAALRTTTDAEALAFWKEHNGKLAKQPTDHARLKAEIGAHRLRMREDEARTIEEQQGAPQ